MDPQLKKQYRNVALVIGISTLAKMAVFGLLYKIGTDARKQWETSSLNQ